MSDHQANATEWLNQLRDSTRDYEIHILCLRRELEAGGLAPDEIGTSDAEIESFQKGT